MLKSGFTKVYTFQKIKIQQIDYKHINKVIVYTYLGCTRILLTKDISKDDTKVAFTIPYNLA